MMNYSIQPLSSAERQVLQKRLRSGTIGITITVVGVFLLSLIMTSFGPYRNAAVFVWGLWIVVGGLIIALISVVMNKVSTDLSQSVKYCGEFPVEKEVISGRYTTTFYLKVVLNGESHRLGIMKEVYDVVLPGEIVYAEFTQRSRTLFRLVIKGQDVSVKIK